MLAVAKGLKACIAGYRLNTAYTPKNLMRMAAEFTGKKYKARAYTEAMDDIMSILEERLAIQTPVSSAGDSSKPS
jgi:hypothetical protein